MSGIGLAGAGLAGREPSDGDQGFELQVSESKGG